jgi:predicted anti-sigma-YlaC factor YlaD
MAEHCREMLGDLSDYLDGELDTELCAQIEQHLARCGDCRILVDTLRQTITLYRTHGHEALPQDARERLYAVLDLPPRP